jgi:hypothetical protein
MSQITNLSLRMIAKKAVSAVSAAALAFVSVFGVSASANASEMAPIIEFDGNILNSSVVHSEIGERPVEFAVGLNPLPLTRVMTTNRAGYSFGGWSYTQGGPAVSKLETSSHTTSRMWLYAVWNTKMNLDPKGGTGAAETVDYRFLSTLTLPTTSAYTKKGFEFAGWSSSPTSNIFVTTYRAAADALGNPTVYAAWKKTITFASKGSTGTVPAPVIIFDGGAGVALPTAAQVSLTRPGYKFMGWSTTPKGPAIKKSASYLPKKANVTLNAVWKKN